MKKKLKKIVCEIDGCSVSDPAMLHKHHIIGRTEIGTSNHNFNTAILCSNHHYLLHNTNRLKIIGLYPSTQLPYARTLVYELDGKKNIDIDEPYFTHKPKQSRVTFVKDEEDNE